MAPRERARIERWIMLRDRQRRPSYWPSGAIPQDSNAACGSFCADGILTQTPVDFENFKLPLIRGLD
jgi:hypothetical protein